MVRCLLWGLLAAAAGCETTTHRQHCDQAQGRWNRVRARVKRQLATQQFEAGHTREAVASAEEALGLDPADAETYVLLIRALLEAGDLSAAERALKAAEAMDLDSPELTYLRGVLAERSQRLSSALEHYRRAQQLDPSQMDYLVAEAECLVALHRPEEARRRVLESLDRFDRDGTLDTLLAEISLMLGDDRTAVAALRRAMPLVGADPLVAEEFGLVLVRLGRFAEALSVLKPLIEDRSGPGSSGAAVRAAAQCYLELGRPDEAATLMGQWLRDHPEDGPAWLLQARAALARGDLLTARRAAETAARTAPRAAEAHLLHGYVCWRQGRRDQAQASLERALRLQPDDALAHYLAARVLAENGKTDRARQHWDRAVQLDPQCTPARNGPDRFGPAPPTVQPALDS